MKRKYLRFLAAAILLSMGSFAFASPTAVPKAAKTNKNVAAVDVVPLFKGFAAWNSDDGTKPFGIAFSYERYLGSSFSAVGRFGFYAGKVQKNNMLFWEIDAHGRYYPLGSTFNKLFIDAGLGFNDLTCNNMSVDEFRGLKFSLALGWKFVFVKRFVCEPRISYVIAKSSSDTAFSFTPVGWQIGFNTGVAF
jgi:hypothetical protein